MDARLAVGGQRSGTVADPYKIVTVVDAGATGLRITETDTYVTGQESYRTDVKVSNTGGNPATTRIWRAADCYLQNSDVGWGAVDAAVGSVSCVAGTAEGPQARIEQWYPLSPGSHYYQAGYSEVWSRIGQQEAFPDTCRCGEYIDNGAGLSWDFDVPAGGSVTKSSLITFSPLGRPAAGGHEDGRRREHSVRRLERLHDHDQQPEQHAGDTQLGRGHAARGIHVHARARRQARRHRTRRSRAAT